jgi:hypothetical protein
MSSVIQPIADVKIDTLTPWLNVVSVFDHEKLPAGGTGFQFSRFSKLAPYPTPAGEASQRLGRQTANGFSTVCFLPCFFRRSFRAVIARAFSVVSVSAARIRSDRQPSTFILISSPLKDPGSRDLSRAGLVGRGMALRQNG